MANKEPTFHANLEPTYAKLIIANDSPNTLISPLNKQTTPQDLSPVKDDLAIQKTTKYPEWSTTKNLKKNKVLDMKPYNRARSLNSDGSRVEKNKEEGAENEEIPKAKLNYLQKFTKFFKRSGNANTTNGTNNVKMRKNSRSKTSNIIYPEPKFENDVLETVNDEDEDRFDIDMFDKEILLENSNKQQSKEVLRALFERMQHMIKYEEEDYVYLNNHDSEEENENNDKKFKLIDPALMYEKELALVSNVEPFYSLYAEKKNAFEMNRMYSDPYPLLELRKKILFVKCTISYLCYLLIKSKAFEALSLTIIIWNTIMLMIDPNSELSVSSSFDTMFLIIYTIEMGLKIIALGFVLNEGSYLRDYWNILDFTIIFTGYIPMVIGSDTGVNLSSLRSLRVLRPLRTISRIKALKTILVALFSALPLILSSVMVNLFFLLIFAIAGLQLFSGLLKRRCFNIYSGLILQQSKSNYDPLINGVMCGYLDCPDDYTCGRIIANPNFDIINFDTIFYSFLMIFQCITLEGWSGIMYYVVRSFSIYTMIFFIVLVWIGAYFLVNLTLAVISTKFKEATEKKNQDKIILDEDDDEEPEDKTMKGPSVADIRNLKLCEKSHHKRALRRLGLTAVYGANEEEFTKEKETELRWDDLFELKERIREERERLDAEAKFNEIREQELEGSNFKKPRHRKIDKRYLPKAKQRNPQGKTQIILQKMQVNSKKLRFVGIQGVSHEKSTSIDKDKDKEKHRDRKKTSIMMNSPGLKRVTKVMEKKLDRMEGIPEKNEEDLQLMTVNDDDELFLKQFSKKAETFKETKRDYANIETLRKPPKTYKKHQLVSQQSKDLSKISLKEFEDKPPALPKNSVPKVNKIQRKSTFETPNFSSSFKNQINKDKRPSLQMNANTFFESQQKLASRKPSLVVDTQMLFKKKPSKKLARQQSRFSRLSSFSEDEALSNLASTILNDSDFNIAGFEKPEKKRSLTLIPITSPLKPMENGSPLGHSPVLHSILPNANTNNNETNNSASNKFHFAAHALLKQKKNSVKKGSTLDLNPQDPVQEKGCETSAKRNEENNSIEKEEILDEINQKSNDDQIINIEKPEPIVNQEDMFKIKDPILFKKVKKQDPTVLLQDDVKSANSAPNKIQKKMKEKKIIKKIFPMVAFTQTDPENNNIDDTDLENGGNKNLSEQASTRTHIESKNTLEQKERRWKIFRSLTLLKRKNERKKEDIEKQKRLLIQKKYNVLHYKLMINEEKVYESNSIHDVLESRIESLALEKKKAFEKEIKSQKHMPIKYRPKTANLKKIDQKRKKQERKMLRDMEKKRQDSIDFQIINDKLILRRILKISSKSKLLPVSYRKNLLTIINKQREALFGKKESRSKATSLLSPTSMKSLKTSMHMSMTKSKSIKKQKKTKTKSMVPLKNDFEAWRETLKEKLYDKSVIEKKFTEFQQEYLYEQIWLNDFKKGVKKDRHRSIQVNLRWSGEDVIDIQEAFNKKESLLHKDQPFSYYRFEKFLNKWNRVTRALSTFSFDKEIWLTGIKGKIMLAQKYLRKFVNTKLFDNSMLLCVIINTAILALDGLFYDETTVNTFSSFNETLTLIFAAEMGLKLLGETPKRYLSDKMNVFDGCVVTISLVELYALSGTKGLSAFRTVRIFRTFRVLRVTRLLRSLEFMKTIINVVSRCVDSLIYIGFLLLLLNVIYSLIGMQIFSGNLNNTLAGVRQNFDDFNSSFLSVYQLMTVENWNDILTVTMISSVPAGITCLYLISWIFFGNYVFLNLILAILLQAFSEELEEQKLHAEQDEVEDFEEKEREQKRKEELEKEQEKRIQAMEAEELEHELLAKTKKQKEKPLFEGVYCSNSLFIFPKSNWFRKGCYIIVHSNLFENFILFLIVVSSLKLAIDTYLPNDDETNLISTYIDNTFSGLFAMECALKVISFGFFMDEGSYLRDNWNRLDFIIVVSSIVDMAVADINLPVIKILRLLRTLRPLRFISHNLNMKIVVTSLLESVGPMINVIIVVLLIFLMFSIFGMSLLQDRFGYCRLNGEKKLYDVNIDQCSAMQNTEWTIENTNFDNIFNSMMTIFILSTQENWPNIMFNGVDSNTSDIGPVVNSMPYIAYFYLICLFVCNIFLINLFVGVIFMNFIEATNSTNPYHSIFLTPEQEKWLAFQKMIAAAKTDFTSYLLPTNKYRKKVYNLINDKYFEVFIMFCIMFNIVTMALTYEGSSAQYDTILENINYFFTAVFILECGLKFVGLGVRAYWYSGWNRFDLFVVLSSIVDILMSTIGTSLFSFLRVGPQLARVLRVMRVSRLLKLVKSLKGIQKLLETLTLALPALMNVGALLILVYFIFSVLGVFLFSDIVSGEIIDDLNNFSNFNYAMVLLFRCSTGESWWSFMFDTYKSNPYAPLYWIPFIVICNFIMMNLFILVILDEFEKYSQKGDSPHTVFKESIVEFRKNWSALTRASHGTKMPARVLIDFFKLLEPEIGFGKEARREMVAKEIMKMNIPGDDDNNVYFNEVLFGALKRTFGDIELTKEGKEKVRIKLNPNTQKLITQEEVMTKRKIEKLKRELIKKESRASRRFSRSLTNKSKKSSTTLKQQQTANSSVFKDLEMRSSNTLLEDANNKNSNSKKKNYLNPLVTILFVGMTFKSWMKFQKLIKSGEMKNDDIVEESPYDSEDDLLSHESSFYDEDVFNEEEQKEYEEKTKKHKFPKKNLLGYESNPYDSGTEEDEILKSKEDDNENSMLIVDENSLNRENNKGKSILKNTRVSGFAGMKNDLKVEKKISLRGEELKGLKSAEEEINYSGK